jgi:hypothetical protein
MANERLLVITITQGDSGHSQQHQKGDHQPSISASFRGFQSVFVLAHFIVLSHFLPPQNVSLAVANSVMTLGLLTSQAAPRHLSAHTNA